MDGLGQEEDEEEDEDGSADSADQAESAASSSELDFYSAGEEMDHVRRLLYLSPHSKCCRVSVY